MSLNPRLYPEASRLHLDAGVKVHYRLNVRCMGVHTEGEGEVELVWLGVTEKVDIRRFPDGGLIRADLATDDIEPITE